MKSKNKKNTYIVPKIRFPEFRDNKPWVIDPLNDYANIINEKAGTEKHILMSITAGEGLVSQKEKFGREIAGNSYKNYYVIKKGDFAYNKSATKAFPEGYIAMLVREESGAVPNSIFTCFRITNENANIYFLNHLFHANYHGSWLKKFITVGARAHGSLSVDPNDLMNMPIAFPKPEEQQKIADCLTSIDELICLHTQRLEALKDYKKGLMQQLFPSEGEKVPRLRFPEYRNAGEWEEKRLGDYLQRKPDYGMNAPAVPFNNKLPTYLRITDISDEGNFRSEGKVSVEKEVTEENYLSNGDIVLTRTGASVGKSYKYRIKDGKLIFAGFLIRIKPDFNKLDSEFLFQFLFSTQYWKWVSFISSRSGQPGINGTEYSFMPLSLPPTIKEQQKIAACLTSFDVQISVQSTKIESLKEHKKGLMQQLFPSPEEVIG